MPVSAFGAGQPFATSFLLRKSLPQHSALGRTMNCIFDFQPSISDIIAAVAVLVAGLSALYAHWSWAEAKNANFISLLVDRRELLKSFIELKHHMTQKGKFAISTEVGKFYWANKMAPFYFPKEITKDINTYYDACHCLAQYNISAEEKTSEEKEKINNYFTVERQLSKKLEEELTNFLQNTKA